jgi:hypothetical protein
MHKMMLGPIGILVACSAIYTAQSAENPAVPAATTPAPATVTPVAPTAVPATPATAPAPAAVAPTVAPAPIAAPAPATAPAAAIPNLSGKWSSNLVGAVTIEQTGNKIVGSYQYKDDDDVTQDGKFEGLIEGKTIKANWWERPKVGKGEESRGTLEWKITDDGKTLTGWYRDEGEKEKQDWNLER